MAEVEMGTVYSMNQAFMENEKSIPKDKLKEKEKFLKAYFMEHIDEKYFMLLCKELSDYTVFVIDSKMKCGVAVQELTECLKNRGKILAIDSAEGNAYEIWIRTTEDNACHAYYLFPYKMGIIEV